MTRVLFRARLLPPAAVCVLVFLLLALGYARAQSPVAAAPTIDSVSAGDGSLDVAWTASTGTVATAYDLRYIRTDAGDKADANWTVEEDVWTSGTGSLEHTVLRLENGVQYDVQVRAVAGSVDGTWSATSTGTPVDHGGTRFTATAIDLNASVVGTIDSASDDDYFSMTLAEASGVFIYTTSYITGFLQTTGDLWNSGGTVIKNDDQDTAFRQYGSQLFLWHTLDAGTYYVRVGASETGAYTLHTQTVKDTTGTADAADLALNGFANGILDPTADDEDYFRIELSQAADLMMRVTRANGGIDTEGALLDAEGEEITVHDDSFLGGDLNRHFLIRKKLEAGVYYLRVRSDPLDGGYEICRGYTPGFYVGEWDLCPTVVAQKDTARASGPYTVTAVEVTAPGGSTGSARPLTLGEDALAGGRIDRAGDADYFSITVAEPTHVLVRVVSDAVDTDGELLDTRRRRVGTHLSERDFVPGGLGFVLRGSLNAGTSYVKVTAGNANETGPYTIVASEDTEYASFIDGCSAISTDYDDPLYGCQWHLNNTGRNGGTVDEDINVEEVWDGGNLGAGINVAVVDNGLYYEHEDLKDNVNRARNRDYTFRGSVFERYFDHGTRVAGVIAARDNGLGGRGVAPRATVYGYNFLRFPTFAALVDAMTRNLSDTAVSNNSWGHRRGAGFDRASTLWELAIDVGVSTGFGGKGIFYAFAGGGGAAVGDNSNLSEYSNYYGVTAVCAVNDLGRRSAYSEQGANLWLCAPSSDSSRSRQGVATTDNYDRYSDDFGGTSAATAIVAGVAALVRNANSDLTWRDVKLILAASARKNDTSQLWMGDRRSPVWVHNHVVLLQSRVRLRRRGRQGRGGPRRKLDHAASDAEAE